MAQMIFNITAELDLVEKPTWFDSFRQKYDKPYEFHITLKTLTLFDVKDLENLKKELSNFSNIYSGIKVVFNTLCIARGTKGWCIMINAKYNNNLLALQKEISARFSKFGEHFTDKHKKFEKKFVPHITIARHLTNEQLEKAKSELKNDLRAEGCVTKLTLAVAKDDIFEEWVNPINRTVFKLKSN